MPTPPFNKGVSDKGEIVFSLGCVPNVFRAALVNIGDLTAYDLAKGFFKRKIGFKAPRKRNSNFEHNVENV